MEKRRGMTFDRMEENYPILKNFLHLFIAFLKAGIPRKYNQLPKKCSTYCRVGVMAWRNSRIT